MAVYASQASNAAAPPPASGSRFELCLLSAPPIAFELALAEELEAELLLFADVDDVLGAIVMVELEPLLELEDDILPEMEPEVDMDPEAEVDPLGLTALFTPVELAPTVVYGVHIEVAPGG